MRTSLNNIQVIEQHLHQQLSGPDEALFQANLLLNPALATDVQAQQQSYQLIQVYGRKQLSAEIKQVQQKLFAAPENKGFAEKIRALFRPR